MKKLLLSSGLGLSLAISAMGAHAGMIKDGVWQIEAGDNLDAILKTVLPNEAHRHQRLKLLATRLNKKAFNQQGELIAGAHLRLPGAKMPQSVDATQPDSKKIGRVLITSGTLAATQKDGSQRRLKRGSAIFEGDTVETQSGRSQLRFSDGSLVALRPNTQFKVEEYNYSGEQDGSERGVYNLLRGGFRTISGAIGKLNKQNYQVKTSVATIGIRGTHYGVTLCDSGSCAEDGLKDGLYGGVVDGGIVVENDSGLASFGNDEYFSVSDRHTKPQALLAPPGVIFGQERQANKKPNQKERNQSPQNAKKQLTKNLAKAKALQANIKQEITDANPIFSGLDLNEEDIRQEIENILNPPATGASPIGTPAPSTGRVHFGFLNSGLTGLDGERVAFQFGTSAPSDVTGQINTITAPDGSQAVSYAHFPTEDGGITTIREFFAPASSSLNDTGSVNLGGQVVNWGRWDDSVIGGQVLGTSVAVSLPTQGLHYLYTDAPTLNKSQVIDYGTAQAMSTVTLEFNGLGTNPTDINGQVGILDTNPMYTQIGLNLASGELMDYKVKATFGTGEHYVLDNAGVAIDLNNILSKSDGFNIAGSCSNGGACIIPITLDGRATLDLLQSGSQLHGITSFAAQQNSGVIPVGFTGTAVLSSP